MKRHFTYLFFMMLACGFISCSHNDKDKKPENAPQKDSITTWLAQAKDTVSPAKEALLEKAYAAVSPLPEDTIKTKHLLELSYQYSKTTGIYPSYFVKELEKELLRKQSA